MWTIRELSLLFSEFLCAWFLDGTPRDIPFLDFLTRGGNEIGVFVNTYQDGFCEHESTDFYETFQVTRYHLTWNFETKIVSQSFLVFQLEPKYEKLFGRYAKTAQ